MGVRKYRGQIVCDKRWPDGTRFTRVCSNKTLAKQLLSRIEVAIADGSWPEFRERLKLRGRETLTLSEFTATYMDEYVKARNKRSMQIRKKTAFKYLNLSLGNLELQAISAVRLHRYVQHRKNQGLKNATVNREITALKHLLNYAVECGLIDANPIERFRKLREELKERPRFTDKQIAKVIDAVRPDCRPLFIFLRETGCRREEALSLQHWQIQEEARLVVFSENTKSMKYRYVPLTEAALKAVHALPVLPDCPYVFYNVKTRNRWTECRDAWDNARKKAELPELLIKDLRRHYAIKLAENGADMHDIQQVLGHASVATTEKHYAQFSPHHSAKKILRVLEGGKGRVEAKRKHLQGEAKSANAGQ